MKLYKNINNKRIELNNEEYIEYYKRLEENKNIEFEIVKKQKINELNRKTEENFYEKYPIYKQNNIAIFGTKEEKDNFKIFYDTMIDEYKIKKEKINNSQNIEELNQI